MDIIDFGKGKVEYNELHIDDSKSIEEQIENLKEDMLQVKYCDNHDIYLLDVGWYPEFNLGGEFKVSIMKNYDWSNPLLIESCDICEFYNTLIKCIYFANNLLK